MTVVYTLKEDKDSGELHLFQGELTPNKDTDCKSSGMSICKKMAWVEGGKFVCAKEDVARFKCAELGRKVCGTCVSSLYATFP